MAANAETIVASVYGLRYGHATENGAAKVLNKLVHALLISSTITAHGAYTFVAKVAYATFDLLMDTIGFI